jgi:AcrR family transcriptional regulator
MALKRERPARPVGGKQERSRATIDAIVEASLRLLERTEAFSVRDLATRAGVGIGSIYDHFRDREGVLDAVLERLTRQNFEALRKLLDDRADAPIEEAFFAVLEGTFDLFLERVPLTRAAIGAIARFGKSELIVAERDRFLEYPIARILRDMPGLDPEEARATARTTTDMVFGLVLANLYRSPEERRVDAGKEMARRLLAAELGRLRAIAQQPERAVSDTV